MYDQNGWKTVRFRATHTFIAHIREHPTPGNCIILYVTSQLNYFLCKLLNVAHVPQNL